MRFQHLIRSFERSPSRPFGVSCAPYFVAESAAPDGFLRFFPTGQQGVRRSYYERVEGIAYLSAGRRQSAGWFRTEPIPVSGGAFEVALFDAYAADAEVGAVRNMANKMRQSR